MVNLARSSSRPSRRQLCPKESHTNRSKGKKSNGTDSSGEKYMVKMAGKITRNSFLNYVRRQRMERDFRTIKDLLRTAGAEWRRMSEDAKQEYIEEALAVGESLHPQPFYKLGERELGPTLRKNLIKFKILMDDAIAKNVEKMCKQKDQED